MLDDVRHVEAVALMRRVLDYAPTLPPEVRNATEAWLAEYHPPPRAYVAAMVMLRDSARAVS